MGPRVCISSALPTFLVFIPDNFPQDPSWSKFKTRPIPPRSCPRQRPPLRRTIFFIRSGPAGTRGVIVKRILIISDIHYAGPDEQARGATSRASPRTPQTRVG